MKDYTLRKEHETWTNDQWIEALQPLYLEKARLERVMWNAGDNILDLQDKLYMVDAEIGICESNIEYEGDE